ncbi:hypothetical protein PF011_g9307 [Phytophthora fragariae]|uniref:Uncharacterized protein n=1 Tax=Phytophthora fragariae TaxID=53985 RepID=A0A6A3KW42_9STRA|nr:hypothetical protein PF011_g9307 [Phytophthora fragariae]
MPFLAIDLPTEEGGSDYEFLGSDSSSSGDDSDVGSTHSGVLSPCVSPASGSSAVSAAPPDRAKSDFRPPATAPGPAVPPSLSPVVGSNGSGAGSAAAIPISGEPESSSPVVDPKGSGAEPETTSAPQTPKSPVISEDSDAIFDASDDEPSQANAPGSSPADSDEPDAIFDDSDDERLQVALARSRSDARPHAGARRRSSSGVPDDDSGSAAVPIILDRGDEAGDASESISTESLVDPAPPETNVGAVTTFQPFGPVSDFVLGLRLPRDIPRSDVVPWDSAQIRTLILDSITPRILISNKVLPPGWLFPKRTGRAGQLDPALYPPS